MPFTLEATKQMYTYRLAATGEKYNGHTVAHMVLTVRMKAINAQGELCLYENSTLPSVRFSTQATMNFYRFLVGNQYKTAYKDLLPLFPCHQHLAAS